MESIRRREAGCQTPCAPILEPRRPGGANGATSAWAQGPLTDREFAAMVRACTDMMQAMVRGGGMMGIGGMILLHRPRESGQDAMHALKTRLARGEITIQQYEETRRLLVSQGDMSRVSVGAGPPGGHGCFQRGGRICRSALKSVSRDVMKCEGALISSLCMR